MFDSAKVSLGGLTGTWREDLTIQGFSRFVSLTVGDMSGFVDEHRASRLPTTNCFESRIRVSFEVEEKPHHRWHDSGSPVGCAEPEPRA